MKKIDWSNAKPIYVLDQKYITLTTPEYEIKKLFTQAEIDQMVLNGVLFYEEKK